MSKKDLLKELEQFEDKPPEKKPISIAARKAKGRNLQNKVAETVREKTGLPKHDVKSNPMGNVGMDVLLSGQARELFPYASECKHQNAFSVWKTLEQCEMNAKMEGLEPLVVFKRDRTKTYAIIEFDHFIDLVFDKG